MAEHPEHPPDPRGAHHAVRVIDDDAVAVAEAELAHARGELLRARQHVGEVRRRVGDFVDVEEHRAGNVSALHTRAAHCDFAPADTRCRRRCGYPARSAAAPASRWRRGSPDEHRTLKIARAMKDGGSPYGLLGLGGDSKSNPAAMHTKPPLRAGRSMLRRYPYRLNHRHDLELAEIAPFRNPALKQRDVVGFHELKAARSYPPSPSCSRISGRPASSGPFRGSGDRWPCGPGCGNPRRP